MSADWVWTVSLTGDAALTERGFDTLADAVDAADLPAAIHDAIVTALAHALPRDGGDHAPVAWYDLSIVCPPILIMNLERKIHALTEALDLFKKTICRLEDHCSLYGQDLKRLQDVSGNEEIFQSVYALHGDVGNDRKKFAESYQQFVSCVSSLPEDLVPFIESDIADQYKQTVHAYRQTLNDALYLESSFKQLKQEIMELIRKEDHHERKRNQRKRVPRA